MVTNSHRRLLTLADADINVGQGAGKRTRARILLMPSLWRQAAGKPKHIILLPELLRIGSKDKFRSIFSVSDQSDSAGDMNSPLMQKATIKRIDLKRFIQF